jgi:hypothetical protein
MYRGGLKLLVDDNKITLYKPLSFYANVPYAEGYYASNSGAIAAGVYTLLTWTISLNLITYNSGVFTIPSAGLYWVAYTVSNNGGSSGQLLTLFTINSASPAANARARQNTVETYAEQTGGYFCNLAVNDDIRFYQYSQNGGQLVGGDATGNRTRCQIIRVG